MQNKKIGFLGHFGPLNIPDVKVFPKNSKPKISLKELEFQNGCSGDSFYYTSPAYFPKK